MFSTGFHPSGCSFLGAGTAIFTLERAKEAFIFFHTISRNVISAGGVALAVFETW